MMLAEGLLHRMQRVAGGEPLNRRDGSAVHGDRERRAGLHRLAVEMHEAGAALAGVAANMGSGQPQVLSQELHQKGARVDGCLLYTSSCV